MHVISPIRVLSWLGNTEKSIISEAICFLSHSNCLSFRKANFLEGNGGVAGPHIAGCRPECIVGSGCIQANETIWSRIGFNPKSGTQVLEGAALLLDCGA